MISIFADRVIWSLAKLLAIFELTILLIMHLERKYEIKQASIGIFIGSVQGMIQKAVRHFWMFP